MAYKFEAKPYFQPAHFGPWPVEPVLHYGDLTAMAIYYVTDKDALASMLPPYTPWLRYDWWFKCTQCRSHNGSHQGIDRNLFRWQRNVAEDMNAV